MLGGATADEEHQTFPAEEEGPGTARPEESGTIPRETKVQLKDAALISEKDKLTTIEKSSKHI